MGLCKSCFGVSLFGSNNQESTFDVDSEKLLLSKEPSILIKIEPVKSNVVSVEPSNDTFIDHLKNEDEESSNKIDYKHDNFHDNKVCHSPPFIDDDNEELDEDYNEVFGPVLDIVQVTVSSLNSIGMLDDVPEHCQHGLFGENCENCESGEDDAKTVTTIVPEIQDVELISFPGDNNTKEIDTIEKDGATGGGVAAHKSCIKRDSLGVEGLGNVQRSGSGSGQRAPLTSNNDGYT